MREIRSGYTILFKHIFYSIAALVVVIQVVFAFAQGRQWYTVDGFECRPTSRGLSVL